jgi:hypothetical protein
MDELMEAQGWGELTIEERKRLPNFFVIGAMKAGTTSLWQLLRAHPDVYMGPQKEPHYFKFAGEPIDPIHPTQPHALDAYLALFAGVRNEKAIGEASPTYLATPNALPRISQVIPDPRFVAILRNPAERAFSSYGYRRSQGAEPARTFEEAVALELAGDPDGDETQRCHLADGFYGRQLSRYLELFDAKQLLVFLLEDLMADSSAAIRSLYGFLGVDPSFDPGETRHYRPARPVVRSSRLRHVTAGTSRITPVLNRLLPRAIRGPTFAAIERRNQIALEYPSDLREMIVDLYRDDIRLLEQLIDRDLSAWLSNSSSGGLPED